MSRLAEIMERKKGRKAMLQVSLEAIVKQLKGLGAIKIIVFGSFAEDRVDVDSDLDLFVVMPSSRTGKEWMDIVYSSIDRKVASDIVIYNEEEFRDMLPVSHFLQGVVKGAVVYEKVA
jgi:predicted nucleotidyltransferase